MTASATPAKTFDLLDGVTPQYEHDCDPECCIFLGRHERVEKRWSEEQGVYEELVSYDLYHHSEGEENVIARYGDWGGDYQSNMRFALNEPDQTMPLVEALRRARLLKLTSQ